MKLSWNSSSGDVSSLKDGRGRAWRSMVLDFSLEDFSGIERFYGGLSLF